MKTKKINRRAQILSGILLLVLPFVVGCDIGNQSLRKTNSNSNAVGANANESKMSTFENDLETMRTAGFEYIFVFRRKDGGVFDGEDRKYLKTNSPAETNRFIATDDDKAFIAGSKYKFQPENLEVLRARFDVQDFSAESAK